MSADSGVLSRAFETLEKMAAARGRHGLVDQRVRRLGESCAKDVRTFLDNSGWLSVDFEDGTVRHMGELLVSSTLAAVLEGAGIRGISVEPHAVQSEIASILEILTRDWAGRSHFDEDLTSAVWRGEFQNVHVDLVEAPRGEDSGVPGILESLRTRLVEGSVERIVCFSPSPDSGVVLARLRRKARGAPDALDIPDVEHIERSLVARDVDDVIGGEDIDDDRVSQVIFEVLRLEFSDRGARRVGEAVARLALDRLDNSDPDGMACLVRRSLVLLRAPFRGRFHHGNAFREGLSDFVSEQRRPAVVGALGRLNDPLEARGPLFTFLSAVHASRTTELALLCYDCPLPELSQSVADAMIMVSGLDKQPLLKLLEAEDQRLHLAPLLACSRMAATQALGACLLRTRSPEPRIREAALRSVRHHDDARIRAAANELLDDDDSRVRIEALRHVAVHRDPRTLERISARLFGPAVAEVGETELKALLITYGILGGDEVVDELMDILLDRTTIAGRHSRLKSFTVRSLLATGTRRGQQGLNEVARKVPEVRDAIRELRVEKARR